MSKIHKKSLRVDTGIRRQTLILYQALFVQAVRVTVLEARKANFIEKRLQVYERVSIRGVIGILRRY